MKKVSTHFLRGGILLVGLGVILLCIFALPRGISATEWWGYKPIFLGMYIPAIPFFIALNESLKLLKYIDANQAFSEYSVGSLKTIKKCAVAISVIYAVGMPYIFRVAQMDDAPGVVAIGFVIIFASVVIAVFAALMQKLVRSALEIKSENDLTV